MRTSRASRIMGLLRAAAGKWKADRADVMAAALAYYSAFSLAPLLLLAVGAASVTAGARPSQHLILALIGALMGPRAAEALSPLVEAAPMRHGGLATAVGAVTLLYGASTLFVHMQSALDVIFRAPAHERGWFGRYLKRRLLSALLVALVPLLLVLGPVWSAWLRSLGHSQAGAIVLTLAFETAWFCFVFKALPDAALPWREVCAGAVFSAALFALCQTLLGLYFDRVAFRSAYGAAASVLAVLIWLHVSAQILLFGAEFIQILKERGRS